MTTIVYRAGVLAGDGRETAQNEPGATWFVVRDDCVKVHKLRGGILYGGAHGSEDIELLRRALVAGRRPPALDDIAGLLIDRRGLIWLYEGRIWQQIEVPYYAVGSGSIFALAALDAGASAEEACAIGVQRDPFSGGLITAVRLGRTGPKPRSSRK